MQAELRSEDEEGEEEQESGEEEEDSEDFGLLGHQGGSDEDSEGELERALRGAAAGKGPGSTPKGRELMYADFFGPAPSEKGAEAGKKARGGRCGVWPA